MRVRQFAQRTSGKYTLNQNGEGLSNLTDRLRERETELSQPSGYTAEVDTENKHGSSSKHSYNHNITPSPCRLPHLLDVEPRCCGDPPSRRGPKDANRGLTDTVADAVVLQITCPPTASPRRGSGVLWVLTWTHQRVTHVEETCATESQAFIVSCHLFLCQPEVTQNYSMFTTRKRIWFRV